VGRRGALKKFRTAKQQKVSYADKKQKRKARSSPPQTQEKLSPKKARPKGESRLSIGMIVLHRGGEQKKKGGAVVVARGYM